MVKTKEAIGAAQWLNAIFGQNCQVALIENRRMLRLFDAASG